MLQEIHCEKRLQHGFDGPVLTSFAVSVSADFADEFRKVKLCEDASKSFEFAMV